MSQVGRIFLDPALGGCMLTDIVSHAQQFLPGNWELVEGDDSDACILVPLDMGDAEQRFPDEVLGRDVFESSDTGERLLVNTSGGPPASCSPSTSSRPGTWPVRLS